MNSQRQWTFEPTDLDDKYLAGDCPTCQKRFVIFREANSDAGNFSTRRLRLQCGHLLRVTEDPSSKGAFIIQK